VSAGNNAGVWFANRRQQPTTFIDTGNKKPRRFRTGVFRLI